ncbi:MAG: chemotaxis protein [Spirochaetae bacterium HGW-Spirochaetae-5]|nr:MAG: chemotaxis protein [Spirochaetae bacterium HGW-Spirochaetae-5]
MIISKKIRFRILFGYSVPLILFIITSAAVYFSLKLYEKAHIQTTQGIAIFDKSKEMDIIAANLQMYVRGYILYKNEKSKSNYEDTKKKYEEVSQFLSVIVKDENQKILHKKILEKTGQLIEQSDKLISLIDKDMSARAINEFRNRDLINLDVEITKLNNEFDEREKLLLNMAQTEQDNALGLIGFSLMIGVALTLILSLSSALLITKGITDNIGEAINAVSTSAAEITATSNQQEKMATQQATMVNETATTMQELGASSRQTSEQASSSAESSQKSVSATEQGAIIVKQTTDAMDTLGVKVGLIAAQVLNLGEQTAQIGNLSNMIKELSGEINMLALNAAVEAARAGEHGKGFAVVAGEVRKLAGESKKSAEQANAIISEIQKATNATIIRTEEGTKVVETVTELVRNVGVIFTTLSDAANNTYESSQQVFLNAQQQASAIGQVVEAVNTLNSGALETANGIIQTKAGVEQLKVIAMNLKQIL